MKKNKECALQRVWYCDPSEKYFIKVISVWCRSANHDLTKKKNES